MIKRMTVKRGSCFALWAVLWFLLLGGSGKALARDNWYVDIGNHWGYPYIRTLWEEDTADGWCESIYGTRYYYQPDYYASRAQFATLLLKVLDLPPACPPSATFLDVPMNYQIYLGKPGWCYIEGAVAAEIVPDGLGDWFRPTGYVTREDAVGWLVRCLDLESLAASLSQEEIEAFLSRFPDWSSVSLARRASMACAVKLGIMVGYTDGYLRPCREMTRAEVAAIVCRSCLIRVIGRSESFSPDGDGVDDSVLFDVIYLRNRGIVEWQVSIAAQDGHVVYRFNKDGAGGYPPSLLLWDGRSDAGSLVSPGIYYYSGWVKDLAGNTFSSVPRPLEVEIHTLSAWASPSSALDGEAITFYACPSPAASWVEAAFADGRVVRLQESSPGTWTWIETIGPNLPFGPQEAIVTAAYPHATRSVPVAFERRQNLWLVASVEPNPAYWGQTLELRAWTSDNVYWVSAELLGESKNLSRAGGNSWSGGLSVPYDLAEGYYPALFVGMSSEGPVEAVVTLSVKNPMSANLVYILAK